MADSIDVQIAKAIVGELNDGSRPWAGAFTAERSWLPVYQPEQLAALRVDVVTESLADLDGDRSVYDCEYKVDVYFQKLVTPQTLVDLDALSKIAEQVQSFFWDSHEVAGMPSWFAVDAHREQIFSFERLYAENVWATLVEVTVRGWRE